MISIFESISFTLKEIGKLEVNQRGGAFCYKDAPMNQHLWMDDASFQMKINVLVTQWHSMALLSPPVSPRHGHCLSSFQISQGDASSAAAEDRQKR